MSKWMTKLSEVFTEEPEEAVTKTYLAMHFLPWDQEGERRAVLFYCIDFEITAVESRSDLTNGQPRFRIEIRDRIYDQILTQRPCDDLEHAAAAYMVLRRAVIEAFLQSESA